MKSTEDMTPFGPLAWLMLDSQISHIMVDGLSRVYVKRNDRLEDTDIQFESIEQLLTVIRQIARLGGYLLDQESSILDFRLSEGTQVNIILPPLALHGPVLTIRKSQINLTSVDDLVRAGTVSAEVAQFLRACIEAKLNIVISGDTTSGKTALFNSLLAFIPYKERLIVIEREATLRLRQNRVVRLVTLPPQSGRQSAVTIRDLLINSLKMLPDRIIVGEVEGSEVLDLIQAGHRGLITSLQADTPSDAFARLERMARSDNLSVPLLRVHRMMVATLDLIVQLARLQDGSYKLINVTELQGIEGELPTLTDIFVFEQQGMEQGKIVGRLKPTGNVPTFMERLKATGVRLPPHLFGLTDS